jgi:predicted  nucleic acid-binding Zn-ribbon protein
MEDKPHSSGGHLAVVASVRCLECGAIYAKPAGGGTVHSNPGCPDCGYVGWIAVRTSSDDQRAATEHGRRGQTQPRSLGPGRTRTA